MHPPFTLQIKHYVFRYDGDKNPVCTVVDPGVKGRPRIEEKLLFKYHGQVSRVRDASRVAIIYEDPKEVIRIESEELISPEEVIEPRNRFRNPTPMEWRDLQVSLFLSFHPGFFLSS